MTISTTTSNAVIWVGSDGRREYPCRCGQTHVGDYALEEWAQHNCFHEAPLLDIGKPEIGGYFLCPDCGKTFTVSQEGHE